MESFTDTALILSLRPYMDKGVVVSALTRDHGRHAGFAYKSALAGVEIGALCDLRWEARVEGQLGTYKSIEVERGFAPLVIGDRRKLQLLQSICAMCDTLLPEREPHPDLFAATQSFLEQLPAIDDPLIAGATYVMWELLVLRALGYRLDLDKCAATETTDNLIYVSPKTGKAVSADAGEPYKDKLLTLPPFLRPKRGDSLTEEDVRAGLLLTQTFFEKWVLTHMTAELPIVRRALA
jgi:DNA repair protein RecO (recombination protein O)